MNWGAIDTLRSEGFAGFVTVRELQSSSCTAVPEAAGVYLVVRPVKEAPVLATESCGGHFKGRNPTVQITVLREHWVDDAPVLYIGKAGGGASGATLRKRLRSYMRFGLGAPVGHWGGRFIWQLSNPSDLLVCWMPTGERDAVEFESQLIREFSETYGRRPYANLRG